MRAAAVLPGSAFNPVSMLPVAPVRVRCGDLEIDRLQRRAALAGSVLRLTRREYALLLCLLDNVNRVVTRSELLAKIWTLADAHGSNVVDVYVRRVRRKLGAHADMIKTVRGFGYRLRPPLGI
ncbi:MAG: winged helix-turn-helix domain-containing protein [Polyangiaceae bacterium]